MAQKRKVKTFDSARLAPCWGEIVVGRNCAKQNVEGLIQMVRFRTNKVDVLEIQFFH